MSYSQFKAQLDDDLVSLDTEDNSDLIFLFELAYEDHLTQLLDLYLLSDGWR